MRGVGSIAAVVMLAAGCDDGPGVDDGPPLCSRELAHSFAAVQPQALDVLFVLDRTASMADQAPGLAVNARRIGDMLASFSGFPDRHVAVVTSELGATGIAGCDDSGHGGRFEGGARCGATGEFLTEVPRGDGTFDRNYQGSFSDTLVCLLDLPLSSCPVSQPLAVAVRALDGSNPGNDGFRRADAPLMLVVITDSDDCSLVRPDALAATGLALTDEAAVDFACFAAGAVCAPDEPARSGLHTGCAPRSGRGLADPAATFATVVGGTPALLGLVAGGADVPVVVGPRLGPVCAAGPGATAAPRLAGAGGPEVVQRVDVCGENWSDVAAIGGRDPVSPDSCLVAAVDLEPEVPGAQVRCDRHLVWRAADGTVRDDRPLPWCGGADAESGAPCLRLVGDDPVRCPGAIAIRLELGVTRLPLGGIVELRCELPCPVALARRARSWLLVG